MFLEYFNLVRMKKIIIYTFVVFLPISLFTQTANSIKLDDLDSQTLNSIIDQGFKLFRKSKCFNKGERYITVPEFLVSSSIPLDEFGFSKTLELQQNLFFKRNSKNRFEKEISWHVVLVKNGNIVSSSDFKQFWCFEKELLFIDFENADLSKDTISYTFRMYNVDLNFLFIVTKNNSVYVHNSKDRSIVTLDVFNSQYEKGGIPKFSDKF